VKKYALCLWDALYDHLCRLPAGERHIYAIVLDRHNRHGVPLLMDLDIPKGTMTRAELMERMRALRARLAVLCLVYDICTTGTDEKMSVHLVSRAMAFRRDALRRDFVLILAARRAAASTTKACSSSASLGLTRASRR